MNAESPKNEAFDLKGLDAPATNLDHERQEPTEQDRDTIEMELYDENGMVGDFQKRAQGIFDVLDKKKKEHIVAFSEIARHALESLFDDWVKELASTLVYDTKILSTMASLERKAHQLEEEKNKILSEVEKRLDMLMKALKPLSNDVITV